MAPKKKKNTKKQQARKQRKQQRRKARVQRRGNTEKGTAQIALNGEDDVIMDLQPFLRMHQSSPYDSGGAEQLMFALLESHDIVDEPEFEDVFIDPIRCVDTFIEIGEERGIDPQKLSELPPDKHEETQFELLDECARRMLTDELRESVLAALNALRLRLKRTSQSSTTARVAALQSFLSDEHNRTVWHALGLIQALVQRSLSAGFTIAEMSIEMAEKQQGANPSLLALLDQSNEEAMEALVAANPALLQFAESQLDTAWDEGEDALYEATLFLDLFTEDERQGGANLMQEVFGYDEETDSQEREISKKATAEVGQTLLPRMEAYVTGLLTPERIEQLQARLTHILNENECDDKWLSFVYMLRRAMEEENVVEDRIGLFMRMMFGEIRYMSKIEAEE